MWQGEGEGETFSSCHCCSEDVAAAADNCRTRVQRLKPFHAKNAKICLELDISLWIFAALEVSYTGELKHLLPF